MALNMYKGWQRFSPPQTVTFLCYNKCIHFLKLCKSFIFPFGYILKYLLMLAVPIKNTLFGTLVAQHKTQVSGLETAVSATGQDIEFSYPSFPLNGIFKAVAFARTQLVAVRSEKNDSMQITLVISCALTSMVFPFSKGQASWLLLRSGLQEVTMMNLICKLFDVPPNIDIPSSLKVLLKRKEGQSYKKCYFK